VRKIFRWWIREVVGSRGIKTGTVEEGKQMVQSGIKDPWWGEKKKKKCFKIGTEQDGC